MYDPIHNQPIIEVDSVEAAECDRGLDTIFIINNNKLWRDRFEGEESFEMSQEIWSGNNDNVIGIFSRLT